MQWRYCISSVTSWLFWVRCSFPSCSKLGFLTAMLAFAVQKQATASAKQDTTLFMRRAPNQWNHLGWKLKSIQFWKVHFVITKILRLKSDQEGWQHKFNSLHQLFPLLSKNLYLLSFFSHPLQFVTPAREDNDKEEANGLSLRAPNFHFLCTVSIAFT